MAPPLSALYSLSFLFALLTTAILAATLRLLVILPPESRGLRRRQTRMASRLLLPSSSPYTAIRVLVVLGSGGHTHEMLHLLRDLDPRRYTHRTYVISSGDAFSAARAKEFEEALEEKYHNCSGSGIGAENGRSATTMQGSNSAVNGRPSPNVAVVGSQAYDIATVPRARRVHQPLLTTPFTALCTLYASFAVLRSTPTPTPAPDLDLPDLILANGPATAVLVILAAFFLKFFDVRGAQSRRKCRTMYVESFARVTTLSLSARLVGRVVDRFVVQWEALEGRMGGRAEYWGVLV